MSAEHGSHEEMRVIKSITEKFETMIGVVGESFKSLANALLSILSLGKIDAFEDPVPQHRHH